MKLFTGLMIDSPVTLHETFLAPKQKHYSFEKENFVPRKDIKAQGRTVNLFKGLSSYLLRKQTLSGWLFTR